MARTPWDVVLKQARSLVARRQHGQADDADLLGRFVARCDESAFEALLHRHGPMVLRVARRVLRSEPDAEDVFQATFLLLARKAGSIRKRESLASWLHGVAHRLALHARSRSARRRAGESRAAGARPAEARVEVAWGELDAVLDDVLAQLPEKYRAPLVYCYLEGRTQEEVARLLGAPLGTVSSRLARGRELLRKRLVRRGVTLSAAGVSTALLATASGAAVAVPAPLMASTLSAAPQLAAGTCTLAALPARVATLVREGMTAMVMAKLKGTAACLLVLVLFVAGTGLLARQGLGANGQGPTPETTASAPQEEEAPGGKARVDLHGDPLPAGALARLGTVRLRHEGWVGPLALSPDGRTIAALADKGFASWDAATGRPVRRLTFAQDMHCLAFAPDGKSVAVGGEDCVVRLLDLDSGKELRRLVGHTGSDDRLSKVFFGVGFTAGGANVLTWGSDKTVRLWEASSGKELRRLGDPSWTVHGLSPDGKLLAFGKKGSEKVLRLWDVAADREVRQLTHAADVGRVAFSPDGKALAAAFGADQQPGKIAVWEIAGGKEKCTLAGHETMTFALAFSPDGKALASGGYDKTLRLWDLDSGKELRKAQRLLTPVYRLVFSGDGKTLVSVGAEHRVRLWDVAAWRERLVADGPAQWVASLAWSPDGKTVASASGGIVWLWESATGKLLRKLETDMWAVSAVAFSADGKVLVAGSQDGTLHVWDPSTGKEPRRIPGEGLEAEQMALSPDGTAVAVWSTEKQHTIVLRHLGTGKELRTIEVPAETPGVRATLNSLRFSRDGRTLYAGSGTHLAILRWDVAGGKALPGIGKHDGGLNGVALSPDERSVAAVTMGGTLYLWELATGQARLVVKDAGYATSVAFSPDGRLLAVANAGNHRHITGKEAVWSGAENREEVRLVRVADGKVVGRLAGHAGGIGCLSFSPDGHALASGGRDTTVVLWDVKGAGTSDLKERTVLKPEELTALWAGLRGEAAEAHGAMSRLTAAPDQTGRFIGEKIRPVKVMDAGHLAALLRKLESEQFAEREEAAQELKKWGDAAEPGLRQALKEKPPVETRRRVEEILDELGGPAVTGERLRTLRAIEVLERIGDKDARDLLRRLSEGAAGAWLTDETRETLRRMGQQRKAGS